MSLSVRRLSLAAALTAAVALAGPGCNDGPTEPKVEPVALVTISPGIDTVAIGEHLQFQVALECRHGHQLTRQVMWRSSDASIATIEATGLVTALRPGSVMLSAISESVRGTATLVVIARAASINLSPPTALLYPDQTLQLTAVALDAEGNAVSRPLVWTTSDAAVATVNPLGVVYALGSGSTTVSAAADGIVGTARITVQPPVGAVTIAPPVSSLIIGQTLQLQATVRDPAGAVLNRPVTWVSADPAIALVDNTGLVTPVSSGIATITAYSEGKAGVAVVTVKPPVDAVSIEPAIVSIDAGTTVQLTATLRDDAGQPLTRPVSWNTGDPAIATVSTTGLVTGAAPGTVSITATSEGKTGTASVTVLEPVATVAVAPASALLDVGESLQLDALPQDAGGQPLNRPVTWSSNRPAVATVDASGYVTAVGPGSVTISATARGKTGSATLTVLVPVAAVAVEPSTGVLNPGATLQLNTRITDAGGNPLTRDVTWVSSNPAIATVDAAGVLTAVAPGTVSVTATARGRSGQGSYLVQLPVHAVQIAPDTVTLSTGTSRQFSATPVDQGGNPLNRPVVWNSSNPAVASVDAGGLVQALSVGTADIGATSEGRTGTATVTVRVAVGSVVIASPGNEPLEIGSTLQLTATVVDVSGNPLTDRVLSWTSSDPLVADVDPNGLVTGLGRGTTVITAAVEGKTAGVSIRVVGESEGLLGNNLSYPVIFSEGYGVTGSPVATDNGLRPGPAEGITVDVLPFFFSGNLPDYGSYYTQQGINTWQAEWLDGTGQPAVGAEVGWGDNLTHQSWTTHSTIRVEVSLYAYGAAPMQGFTMYPLYGSGSTEMQGTDGTTLSLVPTIYAVTPRLKIEKLDDVTMVPVFTLFDGSVHEGFGVSGSSKFGAEINVAGKIVYGYNLMLQTATVPAPLHKYGWWRLTFQLDDAGTVGGATVLRNTTLDRLVTPSDALTYTPQIDPATNVTWIDINVQSSSGGH